MMEESSKEKLKHKSYRLVGRGRGLYEKRIKGKVRRVRVASLPGV